MSIEIKELVVKTTIETDQNQKGKSSTGAIDVSSIVAECVAQVLDILKEKEER